MLEVTARVSANVPVNDSQLSRALRWPSFSSSWYAVRTAAAGGTGRALLMGDDYPPRPPSDRPGALGCGRRHGARPGGMCFGQEVTVADLFLLLVTGVVAGIVSTVASLASVVSYPVLLALGLPPLSANVTNTVSLLFTGVGAAMGSRPELAGQGSRIRRLGLVTALGGAGGAALLLLTPARTFEAAAPILIGGASVLLLLQPVREETAPSDRERNPFLIAALFCVAVYVGYFGAAGGVLLLVVLTAMVTEPLARTNALKNVVSGLANAVAAVAFALFGPVRWAAVLPLAAGFLIGGRIGPILVRYIPARVLRVVIGLAGVALAVKLGLSAYD